MLNISDEELIKGCLKDKRDFQEALYRKYADKMYSVVMIYVKDSDVAADVLQESFIQVFRKLGSYRFDSPLGGWIRRIVINKALEHFRKEKRQNEVIGELDTQDHTNAESVFDHLSTQEIVRMVNELPAKAAMILKLYAIEGYQHNEIASMLEITEGTSKSQLNRARALLRDKLIKFNG